jgi:hypothetical protein
MNPASSSQESLYHYTVRWPSSDGKKMPIDTFLTHVKRNTEISPNITYTNYESLKDDDHVYFITGLPSGSENFLRRVISGGVSVLKGNQTN